MATITVQAYQCERCGHIWLPRGPGPPKAAPTPDVRASDGTLPESTSAQKKCSGDFEHKKVLALSVKSALRANTAIFRFS
jgi:hypothetical protein